MKATTNNKHFNPFRSNRRTRRARRLGYTFQEEHYEDDHNQRLRYFRRYLKPECEHLFPSGTRLPVVPPQCECCLGHHYDDQGCPCVLCGVEMHPKFIVCAVINGDRAAICPDCDKKLYAAKPSAN